MTSFSVSGNGDTHLTGTMTVTIVGSGTVGTALGRGLLRLGHNVVFHDIDPQRIKAIQGEGLRGTTDICQAVAVSEITFICVPTPTVGGRIGLKPVESAVTDLARCLNGKSGYHLMVIKSTVIPTTTQEILVPIIQKLSGRAVGTDVGVCVNPEFLTEIHSSWTSDRSFARSFLDEPLIVIGEWDRKSGDCLVRLYDALKKPILRTNPVTAEMIKYASNCALATRISYWNEIFYVCKLLDIDSDVVAQAVAMDQRIGKYGTIHGKAFGGRCLPKDLAAFIRFSMDRGYDPKLLRAVQEVNERIQSDRGVRE
jgi:UDPglucose 6-dehydrogenase